MKDICILVDRPRWSAFAEGKVLTGFDAQLIQDKAIRAGLSPSRYEFFSISSTKNAPTDANKQACVQMLNAGNYSMIIALDETALQFMTGKKSIWKWHLSPLDTLPEFTCRRTIATFHPDQVKKDWALGLYLEMALKRAATHAAPGPWIRKEERYLLNPSIDESIATLESLRNADWLSLDLETGYSQINTFGVAWSPHDAIAIKVLPNETTAAAYHKLWSCIRDLCESDTPKIAQNGIYERTYLSRYGIHVNNFAHDTMVAQKFLWPELEKGLDNVGRLYTMEPYWKDDGRVSSEEGKQKDWGNIRDWDRHFIYNCRDTSNSFIAKTNQRLDLASRGLLDLYDLYIRRLFDCIYEMGIRGLPLNAEAQTRLIAEYEAKSKEICTQFSEPLNPRSSKQKLKLLRSKGYKLPIKRSTGKESADELSIKKLRIKYPEDPDLRLMLEVAGIDKALSSYLRVRTLPDKRIRFMLDPHGTETGRMSCTKDPWGGGFNVQTMTDYVKQMIEWKPDEDRVFVEFDLEQAETRFVAYDSCEETLLGMLNRKEDIHRYVAAEIYAKPMAEITHEERQLGKKSGHGANYSMGVTTFMDSCLKEMDLVLDRKMASRTLEAYHKLFPGIRRWHATIRNTVYNQRRLTNPLGRVRYFYGAPNDNTYREAYAYRPQSTVPDITNHLMLGLKDRRTEGAFDFWLHAQVHDSVVISCRRSQVESIAKYAFGGTWHPDVILPAGRLVIPTSGKFGACLGSMEKLKI